MATVVKMRNPKTGLTKNGVVGFSWTTLFFNGIPALFRGDLIIGIGLIVAAFFTVGVSGIIAAFVYNKYYTTKLLENGYEFVDVPAKVAIAKQKLGIS